MTLIKAQNLLFRSCALFPLLRIAYLHQSQNVNIKKKEMCSQFFWTAIQDFGLLEKNCLHGRDGDLDHFGLCRWRNRQGKMFTHAFHCYFSVRRLCHSHQGQLTRRARPKWFRLAALCKHRRVPRPKLIQDNIWCAGLNFGALELRVPIDKVCVLYILPRFIQAPLVRMTVKCQYNRNFTKLLNHL